MREFRLHGPPGCGKTRALSTVWVPKAVERFGPEAVVICSLTKTAAQEIASRDLPIPPRNVGTLHALAYRSIDRPKIATGERINEWNALEPMLPLSGSVLTVDDLGGVRGGTKAGDALQARAEVLRHRLVPRGEWPADVLVFQRRWEVWLADAGLVDFTGMIEQALAETTCAPGSPAVLLIDEAQDCSALEFALIRKWGKECEYLVLAGDGDQAIYGWRGASASAFLGGGEVAPEDNYHLTQSYRVPRSVHATATKWIARASSRYAVEYLPRDADGSVVHSAGSSRSPMLIIDAAIKDAESGDVMILATCAYMLDHIVAGLRARGVGFHNPHRPKQVAWNPLQNATRVRAFMRADPAHDEPRNWTWAECKSWVEVVAAAGNLAPGGKAQIMRMGSDSEVSGQVMGEEAGRSVLGKSWSAVKRAFASGAAVDWFASRVIPTKLPSLEYALAVARKGRLEVKPRICVGTIHSIKGGQAPSVILLPDLSRSAVRSMGQPASRDGIIRTMYVGMTRAQSKLTLAGRGSVGAVEWGGV